MGTDFKPAPWRTESRKMRSVFQLVPGIGVMDVTALTTARDSLTTTLTFARPGTCVVAMRSMESLLTQQGPTFNNYLKESGAVSRC